jgi:hypothetical protein
MAVPKSSIYTSPSDTGTSGISAPSDYLFDRDSDGNVNTDQPNDGNYTTPVNKGLQALKGLKKWVTS